MKNFLPKQYKLDSKIKLNHSYLVEQFSDYSKIFKKASLETIFEALNKKRSLFI